MPSETNWIDALSVGGPVLVETYLEPLTLRTVTKFTPTQVVIGDSRFRRDTGRLVGDSSSWRTTRLVEPTEENLRTYKYQKAAAALRRVAWSSLTEDDAIRAWEFVSPMIPKAKL
jgi:hypothetical protein